jgi:hypothetical protein
MSKCKNCPVPDSVCNKFYDCPREAAKAIIKYIEKRMPFTCHIKECSGCVKGKCTLDHTKCLIKHEIKAK